VSQVVSDDEVLRDWLALPRRTYLDTCTLQAMHDRGDVIWDGESFPPSGRAVKVKDYDKDLEALRMILLVNERAMFEFVVIETNLREVRRRNHRR
jgi:hypothetical protein